MRQTSPEDSHTKGIVGRTNHLWAHQLREQIHENFHFHNGDLHATSPHRSNREAQAEQFERKLEHLFQELDHESNQNYCKGVIRRAVLLDRILGNNNRPILALLGLNPLVDDEDWIQSRLQLLCTEIYAHDHQDLLYEDFRDYFRAFISRGALGVRKHVW